MLEIIGNGGHASVIKSIHAKGDGTVIAVGSNLARKKEAEARPAHTFAVVIHPKASINYPVEIGEGTVIMAGAVVQPNARIGKHVIINTCASIDHDCVIGDYAHIAPGVHLCGNVTVGEGALIGVGSCAVPGAKVAPWALLNAGTVIR